MPNEIYNIIFNSDIGTGATPNELFFFDWSRLPDQPYYVSFTFTSSVANLTNTSVCNIFLDLGCSTTFLASSSTSNTSFNSTYLGTLRVSGTGANNILVAAEQDNTPIYLNRRPNNNNINMQFHQNLITQMTDYAPAPVRYTMSLCFRPVS